MTTLTWVHSQSSVYAQSWCLVIDYTNDYLDHAGVLELTVGQAEVKLVKRYVLWTVVGVY